MKKSISVFVLQLITITVFSQQVFDRAYTYSNWPIGWSVFEYPGHGYFVATSNDSLAFDSATQQITGEFISGMIFNLNDSGDIIKSFQFGNEDTLYSHLFGGNSEDYFRTTVPANDGNIFVIGETASFNPQSAYDHDLLILKITINLDTLWLKTVSIQDSAIGMNYATAVKTNQSGIVIPGLQTLFGNSNYQSQITVLDSNGNLIFHKRLLPQFLSDLQGVVQTSDNGFLATGRIINNLSSNDCSPLIIKTDSTGNTEWFHILPFSGDFHIAENIIRTQDGNYVFVWENVYLAPGATHKMWHYHATKIDELGNEQWTKDYVYSFSAHQRIAELPNGNLMISGWYNDTIGGGCQGYLMLSSSAGDSLWWRSIGSSAVHRIMDGKPTMDGGFILTGDNFCCNFHPELGYYTSSLWVVKIDSLGLFTSINGNLHPQLHLAMLSNVYPNPASSSSYVTSMIPPMSEQNAVEQDSYLLLFDLQGRQLEKIKLNIGLNQTLLDLSMYAPGEYILALSFQGYNAGTKRIIKQ